MVIAGRYVMGTKYNPKKDRHFEAVSDAGKTLGLKMLAPEILFSPRQP